MNDKKLEKIQKILELADTDYASVEEVAEIFNIFKKAVADLKTTVELAKSEMGEMVGEHKSKVDGEVDEKLTKIEKLLTSTVSKERSLLTEEVQDLREDLLKQVTQIRTAISAIPAPEKVDQEAIISEAVTKAKNEIQPLITPDVSKEMRQEFSTIKETIEAIEEKLEKIKKEPNRVVGANRNLHQLLDVNVSGITTDQSIKWDGTKWIPYTPGSGGGGTSFLDLEDTPNSYTGSAGYIVKVNAGETALIFEELSGGGHTIQEEGSDLTQRTNLNFIGASVTVTDNAVDDSTDVTIAAAGTPGGSDTQVQFNDASAFGGDADFIWNKTSKSLGIGAAPTSGRLHLKGTATQSIYIEATDNDKSANVHLLSKTAAGVAHDWQLGTNASASNNEFEIYSITGSASRLKLETDGTFFLPAYTSNGFVKTTGSNGEFTVDTTPFPTRDSLGIDTDDTVTFAGLTSPLRVGLGAGLISTGIDDAEWVQGAYYSGGVWTAVNTVGAKFYGYQGGIGMATFDSSDATVWKDRITINNSGVIKLTNLTSNGFLKTGSGDGTLSVDTTAYGTFTLPALTSGSVLFSDGSTIAQDNAAFFWDNANNRLGIGTVSPGYALEVNGTAEADTVRFSTEFVFTGRGGFTAGIDGNDIQIFCNDDIQFSAGAAGSNSMVIKETTGNVGIGQTSPTAKLHIAAGTTTASNAPLKFTSGSLLSSAEAGAVEFLTDKSYLTITTGAARKEFTLNDIALTAGRLPYTTTNGRLYDTSNLTYDATTMTLTGLFRLTSSTAITATQILKMAASQSADPFKIQDSSAYDVARIDSNGTVYSGGVGQSSLVKGLVVNSGAGNSSTDAFVTWGAVNKLIESDPSGEQVKFYKINAVGVDDQIVMYNDDVVFY